MYLSLYVCTFIYLYMMAVLAFFLQTQTVAAIQLEPSSTSVLLLWYYMACVKFSSCNAVRRLWNIIGYDSGCPLV